MPKSAKQLVRGVVANLLRLHSGRLYSAEDISVALNLAANAKGNQNISTQIDAELLARHFSGGEDDYSLQYDEAFRYEGDKSVLHCRRVRLSSTKRATYLGRFTSHEAGLAAHVVPFNIGLSADSTVELVQFLEDKSKLSKSKKKKKRKSEPTVDDDANKQQRTEVALASEVEEANNVVSGLDGENGSTTTSPESTAEGEDTAIASSNDGTIEEVSTTETDDDLPDVLHYILNGRAGKITRPKITTVSREEMVSNLQPLTYEDTSAAIKRRRKRIYFADEYGAVQYWTPAGITGYAANHLVGLRKKAGIANKLAKIFKGKQCTFSDAFLRIPRRT